MINSNKKMAMSYVNLLTTIINSDMKGLTKACSDMENMQFGMATMELASFIATELGNKAALEILFKQEIDVNISDSDDNTLLTVACSSNHLGLVQYLLDSGCSKDATDSYEMTPLMITCEAGHTHIVETLLAHKVDIECRNMFSQTALNLAFDNHEEEIIKLLLAHGADINSVDEEGRTPLMLTILYCGDSEAAIKMIKYGADINAKNNKGQSIMDYAIKHKRTALIEYLNKNFK